MLLSRHNKVVQISENRQWLRSLDLSSRPKAKLVFEEQTYYEHRDGNVKLNHFESDDKRLSACGEKEREYAKCKHVQGQQNEIK